MNKIPSWIIEKERIPGEPLSRLPEDAIEIVDEFGGGRVEQRIDLHDFLREALRAFDAKCEEINTYAKSYEEAMVRAQRSEIRAEKAEAELQVANDRLAEYRVNLLRAQTLRTEAEAELVKYKNEGTTHSEACWDSGRAHYGCALRKIKSLEAECERLRGELERIKEAEKK